MMVYFVNALSMKKHFVDTFVIVACYSCNVFYRLSDHGTDVLSLIEYFIPFILSFMQLRLRPYDSCAGPFQCQDIKCS